MNALLCFLLVATIHTDFEGGSLGRIERVSDTHYRLGAKGEKDQDGRNRQANWYYFRVDGAPKKEMTLDIVDLPGEYNYKPNRGAITKDTPQSSATTSAPGNISRRLSTTPQSRSCACASRRPRRASGLPIRLPIQRQIWHDCARRRFAIPIFARRSSAKPWEVETWSCGRSRPRIQTARRRRSG